MRIALFHNLPSGGAKRVAYEHCRGLRTAGHEVVVFEPETAGRGFCDLQELTSEIVRVPLTWRAPQVRRGPMKLPGALMNTSLMRGNYRRIAAMAADVAERIARGGFDLLYAHHDMFETAPSVLTFARTPSVYFCQEPYRPAVECPITEDAPATARALAHRTRWRQAAVANPLTALLDSYRLINERANTRAADLVLANSAFSAESILRTYGRTARPCLLGVDTAFFSPDDRPKADYVLSVGSISILKGYRFLIRALGRVPPEVRPPLVLVGNMAWDEEAAHLIQLAEQHQVALTIERLISDQALRDRYRAARLLVYAPYLEPLGLAALEAMACGTPVLGVREGGVRETILEGVSGWLVERDEQRFAGSLTTALADKQAVARLGRSAREYVCSRWTWEQSVAELLGFFGEILPQRR